MSCDSPCVGQADAKWEEEWEVQLVLSSESLVRLGLHRCMKLQGSNVFVHLAHVHCSVQDEQEEWEEEEDWQEEEWEEEEQWEDWAKDCLVRSASSAWS